jgi:hypothetical protein
MKMKMIKISLMAVSVALITESAQAQDISSGSRLLIQSDGRDDYSPNIVECASNSGLCLRDTRNAPADSPMVQTASGLQVDFAEWGVVYLFAPNGAGYFFDTAGSQTGSFSWSQ